MRADLLHLFRNLRRSPASAAAAILTLSLTLGVGSAVFAVVHAVLLTPPPFADPGALVLAGHTPADDPRAEPRAVSYATFEAWRARAGSMATLEAFDGTNLTLTGLGPAERVSATDATPGLLALLGVTPVLGRAFESDDMGRPVVIVSHAFWSGRLAADPAVVGRPLVLGGMPHTILGVLPEPFVFDFNVSDLWRPIPLSSLQAARTAYPVRVLGRLARGVPAGSLAAALDEVSRAATPPAHAAAIPVGEAISGEAKSTLGLLSGAAALAALMAFTNLAGLLIVRSIDRSRELAIRSALGARRSEIARQVLLEAQVLVLFGIGGGVLLALWVTPIASQLVLEQFGGVRHREVALNWQVTAAVAAAASVCAWIGGLLPAWSAARRNAADVLRRGATAPRRELMLRRVLVAGQIAVAFVLVLAVGLLGRGLVRLLAVNPGFDPRGVLALQVSLPRSAYPPERAAAFYAALQRSLRDRLDVQGVSIIDELPLTGDRGRVLVGLDRAEARQDAILRTAGPGYFDALKIPVRAGRAFGAEDGAAAPPRVVVSESLAQRLFAGGPAIGRRVWLAAAEQPVEVVGVVGDVKHRALDEAALPTIYLSALQAPSLSSIVVVRSTRPATDVSGAVREEAARLDGSIPVYRVRPLEDVVAASPGMPARRVLTATFTGFAVLALLLGAIGLFGIAAHDVASRRVELAIRIALGANPRSIFAETLRRGAATIGPGLAAGGVLSIWAVRLLGRTGYADGVDLLNVGLAAALLGLAGAAAVLPVARRAARTDPVRLLRSE